jgi:hypothetical protein
MNQTNCGLSVAHDPGISHSTVYGTNWSVWTRASHQFYTRDGIRDGIVVVQGHSLIRFSLCMYHLTISHIPRLDRNTDVQTDDTVAF